MKHRAMVWSVAAVMALALGACSEDPVSFVGLYQGTFEERGLHAGGPLTGQAIADLSAGGDDLRVLQIRYLGMRPLGLSEPPPAGPALSHVSCPLTMQRQGPREASYAARQLHGYDSGRVLCELEDGETREFLTFTGGSMTADEAGALTIEITARGRHDAQLEYHFTLRGARLDPSLAEMVDSQEQP